VKEFQEEAIRLVQTSGKSMSQVARDLGISDSVISHWRQQAKKQRTDAFPGSGHQTAQEEAIRRLTREVALAQQECAMLKKRSPSAHGETRHEVRGDGGMCPNVSRGASLSCVAGLS
jgi:transposase